MKGIRTPSIFGLRILKPTCWAVRAWDGSMTMLDLTYTGFLVPISMAFNNPKGGSVTWLTGIDIAATSIYALDILAGFHVAFVLRYDVRRHLVLDGYKVARYYICYGPFWVDFLACLAIIPELVVALSATGASPAFRIFYALRLLRLLRLVRYSQLLWGPNLLHNPISSTLLKFTNAAAVHIISLAYFMALNVNLLGCIWWLLAEIEGLENSWAANAELNFDLVAAGNPAHWAASIFYASATVTTVGYGDIHPYTTAEQLVAVCFMMFSLIYFGFVVNVVGELMHYASRTIRNCDALRNKLEDVDIWMAERHLPPSLQRKVLGYYVDVWAQQTGAGMPEAKYFEELPVPLRGEIVLAQAGKALKECGIFCHLSEEARTRLAAGALPRRLIADHNLYEEGDDGEAFFVLQEGEVVAIYEGEHTARHRAPCLLGQGAVLGCLLDNCSERLHTVRAFTNCTLWQLSARRLSRLAKSNPPLMAALCKSYQEQLEEVEGCIGRKGQPLPDSLASLRDQLEALTLKVQDQLKGGKGGGKGDYNMQQQQQQLLLDGHKGQQSQHALNGLAPASPAPGEPANGQRGKEETCINVPDVAQ
ncbi:hypothetical protein N2152v2_003713 [Parachlorella kessleri]